MASTYWQKQGSKPLFPALEWNKPERRDQAGRLLIVGGNIHALSAPAKAYEEALRHGIGAVKIALPDKTKRLVGRTLIDAVFLPSTHSGEFAQEGRSELLEYAQWADTLLLAGDVGRNSQTSILLESLLSSYSGPVIATKDALESLGNHPKLLLERAATTLVLSFSQLQRIIKNSAEIKAVRFSMDLVQLADYLHEVTEKYTANLVTVLHGQLVVAANGTISTTKLGTFPSEPEPWRLRYATLAACYLTWYPERAFEALTHSASLLQSNYEA